MKNIDLGSKTTMSYRLSSLLNEQIDLVSYGNAIQTILISPFIDSTIKPKSEYNLNDKELIVDFEIDPQKAIALEEAPYFRLMRDSFLQAMETMELPMDFDFSAFKADVQALQFEQLKRA